MRTLQKITIKNYKSIREQTLELGRLNIFIGGNGVGKSNLISAFRFLREIVTQNLAGYTAIKGGADNLLYFGRKRSSEISFSLEFGEDNISNAYQIILKSTDEDKFTVWSEKALYHEKAKYPHPFEQLITQISEESKLKSDTRLCAWQVMGSLESYRVYHFHDTSDTATVKATCDVDDNSFLRPQAENLAAFLYWLKVKEPGYFSNIEDTVRQVAPFFDGFQLMPSKLNESRIRLEWKEKGSDSYFNATTFSDGTLRFICLATLLLQPELPPMILLDEPELGLHPAAVVLLAEMLASAATRTQVLVSTQSVTLVNQFEPADVWTVDRQDNQSVFRHLNDADMSDWLDDYGLGDLWEKNQFGGRP